jgi:hypothetical protein
MAEDLTGGKGRKDEVGRTGIYPATGPYPDGDAPILTPQEINRGSESGASEVQQDDDLMGVERSPRMGNEDDKPDSDALGG